MSVLAGRRDLAAAEDVLDQADPRRLRLQGLIREHSLKRGNFTLSSGRTSTYLFQLRQTTMLAEGAALLGDIIVDYMNRHSIHCIGGPELGAVPLVASVAAISHLKHTPVSAFFVRKAAKEHGARERIDGHYLESGEALMVDDVATSGGSLLKAVEGLKSENPTSCIRRALVVIDREEGAVETLADNGIQLAAIFKRSDFPELS